MAKRHRKIFSITNHQGNATKNYGVHLIPIRVVKNQKTINADEDVRKKVSYYNTGRNVKYCDRQNGDSSEI